MHTANQMPSAMLEDKKTRCHSDYMPKNKQVGCNYRSKRRASDGSMQQEAKDIVR